MCILYILHVHVNYVYPLYTTCTCHVYPVWMKVEGLRQSPILPQSMYMNTRKNDCLGCAVLLCLVCLFDLACFFLSSFSSLIKNMYIQALTCACEHDYTLLHRDMSTGMSVHLLARLQ